MWEVEEAGFKVSRFRAPLGFVHDADFRNFETSKPGNPAAAFAQLFALRITEHAARKGHNADICRKDR
jgi:hypothetical protein